MVWEKHNHSNNILLIQKIFNKRFKTFSSILWMKIHSFTRKTRRYPVKRFCGFSLPQYFFLLSCCLKIPNICALHTNNKEPIVLFCLTVIQLGMGYYHQPSRIKEKSRATKKREWFFIPFFFWNIEDTTSAIWMNVEI